MAVESESFPRKPRLKTLVYTVTWLQKLLILACPTKSKEDQRSPCQLQRQKSIAALLLDIVVLKNMLPSHDMKISLCNQRIEQELLELQKAANIWDEKFPESFRDQFEDEAQHVKQVKFLTQDWIEIWKHIETKIKKSFLSPDVLLAWPVLVWKSIKFDLSSRMTWTLIFIYSTQNKR